MVQLLKIAHKRVKIDISKWTIDKETFEKSGYKQCSHEYYDVPELLDLFEIECYDEAINMIEEGAFTNKKNKRDKTIVGILLSQNNFQ